MAKLVIPVCFTFFILILCQVGINKVAYDGLLNMTNIYTQRTIINDGWPNYDNIEIDTLNIPHIIWQTWTTHDILHENMTKNIAKNPEWKWNLVNTSEAEYFFNHNLNLTEYNILGNVTKAYFMINPLNGAARADLWRYIIIWKYGGVYLDYDSICHVPLNDILKKIQNGNGIAIITYEHCSFQYNGQRKPTFSQWGLIYPPRHPILTKVIQTVTQNILNKVLPTHKNFKELTLKITGPQIYSKIIYDIMNDPNSTIKYFIDGYSFEEKCQFGDWEGIKPAMYAKKKYYGDINKTVSFYVNDN
eukprot:383527_1